MVPPCRRIRLAGAKALYAKMFPSRKGHPAFPFRMALGALVIQKRMKLSDRALARAVAENPCYQYFIGMQAFSSRCPFTYSTLAVFRRRLTQDLLMKVNELFLATAGPMAEQGSGKRMAKREEWRDDVARNEAERFFSGEKRACDAALIVAMLACATLAGMALSVLVANLFGVPLPCGVFLLSIFWKVRKTLRNGISASFRTAGRRSCDVRQCTFSGNGPWRGSQEGRIPRLASLQFLKNKALISRY